MSHRTATMFVRGGWAAVELPGGCTSWNDGHDCGREDDHPGDHVCIGCTDQWNRGEWDEFEDEADEDYFRDQRPADRCVDELTDATADGVGSRLSVSG